VYNGLSVATLIPLVLYAWSLRSTPLFSFPGPWKALQFLLLLVSSVLFLSGLRRYDTLQFLGFRQLGQPGSCAVLTEDCELDSGGVLGMVRHPWYTGGILVVWARDIDIAAMITNTVITGYFIVGAYLEEKKLLAEFGGTYRKYQKRVSMFLPFKWLRARLPW
jgi:protein-S-isoprenylcysteine O-methyltransferase Ste14